MASLSIAPDRCNSWLCGVRVGLEISERPSTCFGPQSPSRTKLCVAGGCSVNTTGPPWSQRRRLQLSLCGSPGGGLLHQGSVKSCELGVRQM